MVNEEKYFDELQKIIGDIKSADSINERWNEVLEKLDHAILQMEKSRGKM